MKLFSNFLFIFTFLSSLTHASTNIEDDMRSTHILDFPREVFGLILQHGSFKDFKGFLTANSATRKLIPLGNFQIKLKQLKDTNVDAYLKVFIRLKSPIPITTATYNGTQVPFDKLIKTWISKGFGQQIKSLKFQQPLNSLKSLSLLSGLEYLELNVWDPQRGDMSPLGNLHNLQVLIILKSNGSDLSFLRNLKKLHTLYLNEVPLNFWTRKGPSLNIDSFINLTNLRNLTMTRTKAENIDALRNLTELEHLDLSFSKRITDCNPLSSLIKLQHLNLHETRITDLSPLANLKSLKTLKLSRALNPDLSPIQSLIDGGLKITYG